MHARRDQAGEVGHVGEEQQRSDLVGDLAERGEVPHARVGRGAGHDHLRPVLAREGADLVHVDEVGLSRST